MEEITLQRLLSEDTEYSPLGEDGPWGVGMVTCLECGYSHCAVFPAVRALLECPRCGKTACPVSFEE